MANIRGIDDFPPSPWDGFSPEVKRAAFEHARAVRAARLYRRRGWNASAVDAAVTRTSSRLSTLLQELQHLEDNPPLF